MPTTNINLGGKLKMHSCFFWFAKLHFKVGKFQLSLFEYLNSNSSFVKTHQELVNLKLSLSFEKAIYTLANKGS